MWVFQSLKMAAGECTACTILILYKRKNDYPLHELRLFQVKLKIDLWKADHSNTQIAEGTET